MKIQPSTLLGKRATNYTQFASCEEMIAMHRLLPLAASGALLMVGSAWFSGTPAAEAERAFLGVQVLSGDGSCQPAPPDRNESICLGAVRPDGAADRAGLRAGDRILAIDQEEIAGMESLMTVTQTFRVGQSVQITYKRGNDTRRVLVQLDARDRAGTPAPAFAPIGELPSVINQVDACDDTLKAVPTVSSPPYRKQPLAGDRNTISGMLGSKDAAIVLEGDVLTFAFRAPGNAANVAAGSVQCSLDRVGDSDLWALQLKLAQWDRAFLSAQFMSLADAIRGPVMAGQSPLKEAVATFRGNNAPSAPAASQPLRGSLRDAQAPSRHLGAPRQVSVYLPPGPATKRLPVLYLADGQDTAPFAAIVDSLIVSGKIPRMAVIGVHSGRYKGDPSQPLDLRQDDRAREYLPIIDPPQFERHMRFFLEELLPWAEQTYGVSAQRKDRAAMGYSNGGAFAAALGMLHPDSFATILSFSPAWRLAFGGELSGNPSSFPRFLFSGGELEPLFLAIARANAAWLSARGAPTSMKEYWSGHDSLQWQQALTEYLPGVFPLTNN